MPRFIYTVWFLWILNLAFPGYCMVWNDIPLNLVDTSYAITGKVLDIMGNPVPGVTISVEGEMDVPVVSDSSGSFSLNVNSMDAWILVSPSEHYKSSRIYLNNRKNITIYLTPSDLESIHDIVQTPFGQEEKKYLSYPIEDMNPASMAYHPNQNTDQTFSGLIPGLFATGHSGMPGSGVTSYIRGITSMHTTNQPLYVVDGVPLEQSGLLNSFMDGYSSNPLASLDPNDITSIRVYRDYATGSLFGMRGSNGVILIETLKPTEVQTTIDFGVKTGIVTASEFIPQLNSVQYRSFANEVLLSSGMYEEDFPEAYPGLYSTVPEKGYYRYNHNTQWQNEVFDNSIVYDTYLRIKGGDQITRYGLSVGYLNHAGSIKETNFDRFNITLIGTFNIFSWLRMYITSNLTNTSSSVRESARVEQTSPLLTALQKSPLLNPYSYDQSGERLLTYDDVEEFGISNPSVIINKNLVDMQSTRILNSFRIEGDFGDHLKWNSLFGMNYISSDDYNFVPNSGMELLYEGEVYNMSRSMSNYYLSLYNNNYLQYSFQPGTKSDISLSVGLSINTNRREEDWAISKNSNENDEYTSLQSGTNYLRELGGWSDRWNRMSLYSHASYIRSDRYILKASINNEFSSKTGRYPGFNSEGIYYLNEIPVGLFYSVGGAWRLSQESFLKDFSWLEDVKLRVTWGTTGNDDIGAFNARRYFTSVLFREVSGLIPGNLIDRSLQFESNSQLNPGLDISLWAGRFRLSADWYTTFTDNMLVYKPVESYTGFTFAMTNDGSMLTQGWELSSSYRVLAGKRLNWDIGFNIASYENEVLSITNDQIITHFHGGAFISRVGEPLQSFYGYLYEGVFEDSKEAEEAGLVNGEDIPFRAGDAIFRDIGSWDPEHETFSDDRDGVIDKNDKTIIGSPIPDFYGGIYTTFKFGRWSADVLFQFVYGNDVFNYLRYQNEKMSDLSNQSSNVLNRWQYEGHQTETPRALWNDPVGNSEFSSRWIEDGSYFRLKNLRISYQLNTEFLFFRNAEMFVSASNLFTISNYLGYDPEFSFSFNNMEQGIDYGMTPHTRKMILGIKIGL